MKNDYPPVGTHFVVRALEQHGVVVGYEGGTTYYVIVRLMMHGGQAAGGRFVAEYFWKDAQVACCHCSLPLEEHAANRKCLYSPTYWETP